MRDRLTGQSPDGLTLSKRTAIVAIVVAIVLVGAGIGFVTPGQDEESSVQRVTATDGPDGAQATVALPTDGTASVDFSRTAVGTVADGTALRTLNVSVDEGGTVSLFAVRFTDGDAVADAPTNRTMDYLNVGHTENATIDSVDLRVTLTRAELAGAGVDPDDVTLYRRADGEWQTLETALVSRSDDEFTYRAVAPGMSVFAVGGPETTPDDEETPDEETPDEETPDEETPDEETPDEETPNPTTPGAPPQNAGGGGGNGGSGGGDAFSAALATTASDASVTTDRGDVDVVAGSVAGELTWSDDEATRAVLTVSVGDGSDTTQLRRATVTLGEETNLSLAEALVDTRLLYVTGDRADALTVRTDGATRTSERTVTVTATLYDADEEVATTSDESVVEITVTNAAASSAGSGESNADAG
jgi:PGF-pre-PGF domain-containing protein